MSVSDDYSWRRACSSATNCVEVAAGMVQVAVRDGKDPDGPVLRFPRGVWREFVKGARALHDVIKLLAAPFASHPDVDPAWVVEGTVTT